MSSKWVRQSRKTIYNTKFLRVHEDTIALPNGVVIDDYSVVDLPSGVVIVATDETGKLLAQYEYKYAINKTILNLPSGSVESGENPLDVARRELREETGYESNELELIKTLYEYASKTTHVIHVVRAKNAQKLHDVAHEETEAISDVMTIAPDECKEKGGFNTTYNLAALALTLPDYIR